MSQGLTFEQACRQVCLEVPAYPFTLAQRKILECFDELMSTPNLSWPQLHKFASLRTIGLINAGTVSVSGAVVTGSGTSFGDSLVGCQFRNSPSYPIKTIAEVNAGAQTLTLDSSPGDLAAGSSYEVFQNRVILAADMLKPISVSNISLPWKLLEKSLKWLEVRDPRRISKSNPMYYIPIGTVAYRLPGESEASGTALLYELYPIPSAATNIIVSYISRAPIITDDSTFPQGIREQALIAHALAEAWGWWAVQKECPNPSAAIQQKISYVSAFKDQKAQLKKEAKEVMAMISDTGEYERAWMDSDEFGVNHNVRSPIPFF